MKAASFLLLPVLLLSAIHWHNDLDEAKQIARMQHKYILLNFSGSDWCGPCMRMHDEIFGAEVFKNMADTQLVLVNADFPRKKKNQLSPKQQEINNKIADQYNAQGKFPYTLLLDTNGKVLKDWDGLPNETPEAFTIEVRNGIYTNH
ncbi:MAG TPA: thioredoxin family protein [Puia sp.]|jgi:thioredoxin-related protein|nr:thioredoxin family protein [Puia sp.]